MLNTVALIVRMEEPPMVMKYGDPAVIYFTPKIRKQAPIPGYPFYDVLEAQAVGPVADQIMGLELPRLVSIQGHLVTMAREGDYTSMVIHVDRCDDMGPAPDNSADLRQENPLI